MSALTMGAAGGRALRRGAAVRLVRLHLLSRQVPGALLALVGCGIALRCVLLLHWVVGDGAAAQQTPLLIEAAAASVVAVAARNPFGESERSTGRWLPYLRVGSALALTGAVVGLLAAGAAGAHLPGGCWELLRSVAGLTGIGLLSAAALGGAVSWVGPLAYTVVAEFALAAAWRTPWIWVTRPGHDTGAGLFVVLVLLAGVVLIALRGPRD
ncbi:MULTISPECIES: hypothetical protein [Streptacidiphilus]|uniref:ABC transporter permease n=1 Tax=Streptacidiphilus cavernicola TaxID=3342716 RepID=A0ABV6UVU7_9ACTN|nr:hypothetical protein [Streptacidiphilus jeojiense]